MYVTEKLKLNKFQHVAIPKKSEYMARFGAINNNKHFTGDEMAMKAVNKVEEARQAMEMYQQWVAENRPAMEGE